MVKTDRRDGILMHGSPRPLWRVPEQAEGSLGPLRPACQVMILIAIMVLAVFSSFQDLTNIELNVRPKEQQQPDVESADYIHFKHSDGHGLKTFTGKRHTVLQMFLVSWQYVGLNSCQHGSATRETSGSSGQLQARGC